MSSHSKKKKNGKGSSANWGSPLGLGSEIQPYDWDLSSSSETPQTAGTNWIAEMNEDILHLIFENFDFQPGSPTAAQTRKDLLSAARVCKAFAEPALDSLWRVLPSLLPLLLLLPSAEIVNNQYFVDNLPACNWERFEIHVRRVRTLYMEAPRVAISPIVYLRIRSLRDGPLLPGLKAIHIPDSHSIDFPSIILLVSGASLDVVELNHSAISERNFFLPFLSSLASKSPQVADLALRGTGSISLEPVYRLTSLQRLEIKLPGTYLYPQTVRRLGNLVNLKDLTLDVGAIIPAPEMDTRLPTSYSLGHRNFGQLTQLHIIGIPKSITRILDDINLANLITLVIDETPDNSGGHTQSFWMRCFDQISMCQALEDIEINQIKHRSWGHDRYSLSTSWFSSLLNLNSVKSLIINGSALSGSDEDFRLLACAFPKLKKLVVPPVYYSQGRTLACLFYFSQQCPDLSEIKICLGFDILKNLDAVKKLPHPIPLNHLHPLEKLYINSQFGQLQPIHMIQVAQFLDLLFPNLSILESYDSNTTETSNWMGIQQFCVALGANRTIAFQYFQAMSEVDTASMEFNN